MKTPFIVFCLMLVAGAANATTLANGNSTKDEGIVVESATWSADDTWYMGNMEDEGYQVEHLKGNYTAKGGGTLIVRREYQDTNQVTRFTQTYTSHILPDTSVSLLHYEDSDGNEYDIPNADSVPIVMEEGSLSVQYNNGVKHAKMSKVKMTLHTGGGGGAGRQALVEASASATEQLARPIFVTGGMNIPFPQIRIEGLGKNLAEDGLAYGTVASGAPVDVTPKATSVPMHGFITGAGAPVLAHRVRCVPAGNTNLDRTILGVGEVVDIYFSYDAAGNHPYIFKVPITITWTTGAGSVSPPISACGTVLTSPSSAATATVTATVRGESVSIGFGVEEPSGYDHADITSTYSYGNGVPGAGMHLNVYLAPTSVSFSAVQIYEVGQPASGISGYFINHPPTGHGDAQGANVWQPVGCDNLIGNNFDNATYYGSGYMPSPWTPGGGFTWHVPVLWKVGNGSTNSLTSWDQVFTLQPNGTFTVSKFNHAVTRTINNSITTQ